MEVICPYCKNRAKDTDFFCSTCGKKLKEPPLSTSVGKQLGLYIFAILLPPFGIIPAIKYLKADTQKARGIGVTILLLTTVVIVVTVVLTMQVLNEASRIISTQQMLLPQENFNY